MTVSVRSEARLLTSVKHLKFALDFFLVASAGPPLRMLDTSPFSSTEWNTNEGRGFNGDVSYSKDNIWQIPASNLQQLFYMKLFLQINAKACYVNLLERRGESCDLFSVLINWSPACHDKSELIRSSWSKRSRSPMCSTLWNTHMLLSCSWLICVGLTCLWCWLIGSTCVEN